MITVIMLPTKAAMFAWPSHMNEWQMILTCQIVHGTKAPVSGDTRGHISSVLV